MKADDVIGDIKSMLNRLVLVSSSKGYQLDRTPPVAAEDRITDADVDHIEQAIVEKLNELREAALTAGGWQEIASCPKDGTWFLAWDADGGFYTFRDGPGLIACEEPSPTLWMPIPPLPKESL